MMRFAKALAVSVLPLLVIAGMLPMIVNPAQSEQADQVVGDARAQVEDDPGAEDASATEPPSAAVQRGNLLSSLSPSGEPAPGARVFLTRDPFDPVVVEEGSDGGSIDGAGDGGGADGGGTDGGGTDGGGTDGGGTDGGGTDGGGTDGGGTDGGGATDPCSGNEDETVCEGRVVTLDAVTDTTATVTVDGVKFEVGVDDQFATNFEVLAIDPPCATLLYGDEAFTLCTGVTVLK